MAGDLRQQDAGLIEDRFWAAALREQLVTVAWCDEAGMVYHETAVPWRATDTHLVFQREGEGHGIPRSWIIGLYPPW